MLRLLDILLAFVHVLVVAATMTLWWPKRTRRWHLGLVGLVTSSWLILGPLRGRSLGYCFLTEWHWDIKRRLGETDLPSTFILWMFESVGIDATAFARPLAGWVLGLCVGMSIVLNGRDWWKRRLLSRARVEASPQRLP